MRRIVFDIETVGYDFDSLDGISREYFLKYADTDEKREEIKNSLSFYPLTGQIVAIGMLEVETKKGAVYYQGGGKDIQKFKEDEIFFVSCSEKEMLENFWKHIRRYEQFVSFNGRVFDCPFILLRSAINSVRAAKNLMPYRYSSNVHIDLADQLSFYDAMRRRFTLHIWCKAFGIKSPKEEGVTGLDVGSLYKNGEYQRIARYCMRDIIATKELFCYWDRYLKF